MDKLEKAVFDLTKHKHRQELLFKIADTKARQLHTIQTRRSWVRQKLQEIDDFARENG